MNIIIPRYYRDLGLTEREAVLVAFMVIIAHEHGWEHNYNISPYDINKILDTLKGEIDNGKLTRLKEVFQFTYLNDSNWMIKWKGWSPKWYTKIGSFRGHKYKLEDTRNQRLWCYLLGLYRGSKDLVEDSKRLFEHEDLYNRAMSPIEIDNFKIENRKTGPKIVKYNN
jgi:hypothetical protein